MTDILAAPAGGVIIPRVDLWARRPVPGDRQVLLSAISPREREVLLAVVAAYESGLVSRSAQG